MLPNTTLATLLAFRDERDWQPFHTPKNLASALVVEAAELLECFQWASDAELPQLVTRERGAIVDEIADIGILLSYLCHDLNIDLEAAMVAKIEKNRAKYPVEKARGHAKKYDRL
jgi:NTP pyrophosphatase (non-canonical NTP hydrolase)